VICWTPRAPLDLFGLTMPTAGFKLILGRLLFLDHLKSGRIWLRLRILLRTKACSNQYQSSGPRVRSRLRRAQPISMSCSNFSAVSSPLDFGEPRGWLLRAIIVLRSGGGHSQGCKRLRKRGSSRARGWTPASARPASRLRRPRTCLGPKLSRRTSPR